MADPTPAMKALEEFGQKTADVIDSMLHALRLWLPTCTKPRCSSHRVRLTSSI